MKELLRDFEIVEEEAIFLIQTYKDFNVLFNSSEPQHLLEMSAESFFFNLSRIMRANIILSVCSLTDEPGKSDKTNHTIPHINKLLSKNECFNSAIEKASKKIMCYRTILNPARNKIIAHHDRDTYIENITLGVDASNKGKNFFENDLPNYFYEVRKAIGLELEYISCIEWSGDASSLIDTLRIAWESMNTFEK